MVGFSIMTHGGSARGVLDSIELIARKRERIDTISILHETNIDVFGRELTGKIVELDDGDGVVVFCNLLLTNPYNRTTMNYRALQGKHEYRIMSGASLPMILEALNGHMQDPGPDAINRMTQNTGRGGIQEFFEKFAEVSNTGTIQ